MILFYAYAYLLECMCFHWVHAMPEEARKSPKTGVTDSYEMRCGHWDALQNWQMLFIAKPSL